MKGKILTLLIGTKNNLSQSVLANGLINLNSVYKRYSKTFNGKDTFTFSGTSLSLNQTGIYRVTATLVGSGNEAGVVTVALNSNGETLTTSSETITTATTEQRTFTLDYFITVDRTCILGIPSTLTKTISLVNTGVAATFTNVVFNVEKVA